MDLACAIDDTPYPSFDLIHHSSFPTPFVRSSLPLFFPSTVFIMRSLSFIPSYIHLEPSRFFFVLDDDAARAGAFRVTSAIDANFPEEVIPPPEP
jgi:hypothetical protein